MKEIKLSSGMICLVDDYDYEWAKQYNWHYKLGIYNKSGYAYRCKWNKETKTRKMVTMHRELMNAPKGLEVDHINHNTIDNRRENLRLCTHKQNMANKHPNQTTGKYKGVSYVPANKFSPWVAACGGKFVGTFKTELEAAMAYNGAVVKEYGSFAVLNDCGITENYISEHKKKRTSKYKGVKKSAQGNGWSCYYKAKYIGYFKTEEEAKAARDKYVSEYTSNQIMGSVPEDNVKAIVPDMVIKEPVFNNAPEQSLKSFFKRVPIM